MNVRRVLTPQDVSATYPCAMETPPPFWANGLPLSRAWFAAHLGKGVEGFHLEDKTGVVFGHIYWVPAEKALVPYRIEEGVAFEYCEWIQRAWQGKGGMQLLFRAFVDYLQAEHYKGILVDGTEYEGYMHYRHFLKRGFRILRESDGGKLMYYPLSQENVKVEPIPVQLPPEGQKGICIFGSLFCPVGASAVMAVRNAVSELGDKVRLQEISASREVIERYGIADGIYINGRPVFFGPVKEDQVKETIKQAFGIE